MVVVRVHGFGFGMVWLVGWLCCVVPGCFFFVCVCVCVSALNVFYQSWNVLLIFTTILHFITLKYTCSTGIYI